MIWDPTTANERTAGAAFDNMWALQDIAKVLGDGLSLVWSLGNRESQFYGPTLAAIAVGIAPENYRSNPGVQNNLTLLREYLNRELAAQTTINRVVLLWGSIIKEVQSKQRGDGGWSLSSLAWPRHAQSLSSIFGTWLRPDGTWQEFKSDAYATGLIIYTLQEVGTPRENVQLKRGLSWLAHNQNKSQGVWLCYSLKNSATLPRRLASS